MNIITKLNLTIKLAIILWLALAFAWQPGQASKPEQRPAAVTEQQANYRVILVGAAW